MTISPIGSPIDLTDGTLGTRGGGTISLAERMRSAAPDGPSGAEEPEKEFDPLKFIYDLLFAEFQEKLQSGDEEETGMVTLESDF